MIAAEEKTELEKQKGCVPLETPIDMRISRKLPLKMEHTDISIPELLCLLRKKLVFLVAAFFLGALLAGLLCLALIQPKYQADSMVYLSSQGTGEKSISGLQLGSQAIEDFLVVAKTQEVMDRICAELGITMSFKDFTKKVDVSNPRNSHILKIEVTDSDPELAAKISDAMAAELCGQIAGMLKAGEPDVVHHAYVPAERVNLSPLTGSIIGGCGFVVLLMLYFLWGLRTDDTLKRAADIDEYLGLSVLAVIPGRRKSILPLKNHWTAKQ